MRRREHNRGEAIFARRRRRPNAPRARARAVLPFAWLSAAVLLAGAAPARASWPTHRGSARRTGNIDDRPGPRKPKVLWAYRSQDQFLASPVPGRGLVYVPGLGAFNTGVFHCLSAEPRAPRRMLWSKAAPFVRRPTVCSPAVADGLLVFGDGMHQTDDALLYCLHAASGRLVWQYAVPGRLVHLEGSPTIAGGRVYAVGGDAGVLCLELKRLVLEGKEVDLETARGVLSRRWRELLAKYEQQKKQDPDFAMPPTEDSLPKPAPKLVWQAGKGTWHVDAPPLVVADRVLVASALLDLEKVGRRSLLCLNAADGTVLWDVPLKLNPWAGATAAGNLALVGCSTIRYEVKQIPQARGEIVAVEIATGKVRWRKDVPGGVLSAVAVKDNLAVFAATDGKVRAWNVADGGEKWAYDASAALFAGPALAGDAVYVADLRAVVHAIGLADGKKRWTLEIATDPATQAPGMAFASPVVHDERVYVATCNVGGPAGRMSVVACIADESAVELAKPLPPMTIDRRARAVAIPCRIAPRKLATLKEIYPVEVVATYPAPRGRKAHETVVTVEARPSDVHKALVSLGLKPGHPGRGREITAAGPRVWIRLELPGEGGPPRRVPIERALVDRRTGRPMAPLRWYFTGSAVDQPDPDSPQKVYGADGSGTLMTLFPVTDETVFQTHLTMDDERMLKLETNKDVLGPAGTLARLIVATRPPARPPAPRAAPAPRPPTFPLLPPTAAAPQAWPGDVLVRVPLEPPLPPADANLPPRILLPPSRAGLSPRAGSLAPPASAGEAAPLPRRTLPAGPPARATRRAPSLLWLLSAGAQAASDRPELARQRPPKLPAGHAADGTPPLRDEPLPYLELGLPNPFRALEALRLGRVPADRDPPATDSRLPEPSKLPVDR